MGILLVSQSVYLTHVPKLLHYPRHEFLHQRKTTDFSVRSPGCREFENHHNKPAIATNSLPDLITCGTNLVSLGPGATFESVVAPACVECPHFSHRGCSLTATAGSCCACADLRPQHTSGVYPTYVDGKGWVEEATRWAGYCPNCQQAHIRVSGASRRARREKGAQKHNQRRDRTRGHIGHPQKPCIHWKTVCCSLTSKPKRCCACSDKRQNAPSYSMYVDGLGWIMGATRWANYCPSCRGTSSGMASQFLAKASQTTMNKETIDLRRKRIQVALEGQVYQEGSNILGAL